MVHGKERSTPHALLDAIAFSGLLAGGVAAALVWGAAMALTPQIATLELGELLVLALAGTLVVYNVDRLRDIESDRSGSPARTRFIEQHRGCVLGTTWVAAAGAGTLALRQPPGVWWLCCAVLAVGLLHRRLKGRSYFKLCYVTLAWLGVVIGLPVLAADAPPLLSDTLWLSGILGAAIGANLVASNLRGRPAAEVRSGLRAAFGLAAAGVGLAFLAGVAGLASLAVAPLGAVPASEIICLTRFRPDERYGLVVVDGTLLLGALLGGSAVLFVRQLA